MKVWKYLALAGAALTVAGYQKIRIPREPDREGFEDAGVVKGYDRLSRWPVMETERLIAMSALKKYQPQGTIADTGCGPGYLADRVSREYPQVRVVGLDSNIDMLMQARRNFPQKKYELCLGNAQDLPLRDGSIDVLLCTGAFHHFPDGAATLVEFLRVLKPGGRLFILELRRDIRRFYFWAIWALQQLMPPDIRRVNGAVGSVWSSYTIPEMEKLMGDSGFADWRIQKYPFMMLIHACKGR